MSRHNACRRGRRSPEYQVWLHMRERCMNPRHLRFRHYGGRGITVDPRWDSFPNFLADMGERPPGLTLDRIDVDGPYAPGFGPGFGPGTCRWSTVTEQNRNRRPFVQVVTEHCGGRDGSPRCGWWAGHAGVCQTPPDDFAAELAELDAVLAAVAS